MKLLQRFLLSVGLALTTTVNADGCNSPLDEEMVRGPQNAGDGFLKWIDSSDSDFYKHRKYISNSEDTCLGASFLWTIKGDRLSVAVAVKATGWVGLGWSETGGMRGMDLFVYESASNKITDSYVGDGYVAPTPDPDDRQDWILVKSQKTSDGYMIVEAERLLNTHDDQYDWPIRDDRDPWFMFYNVLAAWGDTPNMMYHMSKRGRSSLQFYLEDNDAVESKTLFRKEMAERSDGSIVLKHPSVAAETTATYYNQECFSYDYLTQNGLFTPQHQEVWLIGYEYVVPKSLRPFLHHLLIFSNDAMIEPLNNQCNHFMYAPIFSSNADQYGRYPEGFGVKMGRTGNSVKAILAEVHLNNPSLVPNLNLQGLDVTLYYTTKPVKHELGGLMVADAMVALNGQSVGVGKMKNEFTCSGQFTSMMKSPEVTVVQEYHHMHLTGKRLTNNVLRGNEIVSGAETNFYDFDMGFSVPQQEPYILKPGDEVKTSCYTDGHANYGFASTQEMCVVFMAYYPKQDVFPIWACSPTGGKFGGGEHQAISLNPDSHFNRIFATDIHFSDFDDDYTIAHGKYDSHGKYDDYNHAISPSKPASTTAATQPAPKPPAATTTTTAATQPAPKPPAATTTTATAAHSAPQATTTATNTGNAPEGIMGITKNVWIGVGLLLCAIALVVGHMYKNGKVRFQLVKANVVTYKQAQPEEKELSPMC